MLDRGQGRGLKCQAQQPARGWETRCWKKRAQPHMAAPTPPERCPAPDPTLPHFLWALGGSTQRWSGRWPLGSLSLLTKCLHLVGSPDQQALTHVSSFTVYKVTIMSSNNAIAQLSMYQSLFCTISSKNPKAVVIPPILDTRHGRLGLLRRFPCLI